MKQEIRLVAFALDEFLERFAKREGLITSEQCECKFCTAERAADLLDTSLETTESEARTGDELVSAFIRGFNFKAAGEPLCETSSAEMHEKRVPLTTAALVAPKDLYFALCASQGNDHLPESNWDVQTQSVHNHYETFAFHLNKRLQAA
jgi:hypothetical protein